LSNGHGVQGCHAGYAIEAWKIVCSSEPQTMAVGGIGIRILIKRLDRVHHVEEYAVVDCLAISKPAGPGIGPSQR